MGNRPENVPIYSPRKPTRKTLRRDNDVVLPGVLPALASYNMRSLFPKIKNLSLDIMEREIGLAFLSEIWEKEESKEHQYKLEEMFEMNGLAYISNPRKVKRGGGAAIIANTKFCTIKKLPIIPPKPLEVVWGLVKPTSSLAKIKQIIAVSFYAPPKTKKSGELLDHITCNIQELLIKYPNAGIVISGDRNDIALHRFLSIDHTLRHLVTLNTRKNKLLDIIVTNMRKNYNDSIINPAVNPDDPNIGKASDHQVPVCY